MRWATGYRNLLTGDVLAPPQRQQFEDWLRGNETSSMRAGLPEGWTTADKTGNGDYGSTNDIGIAYGPEAAAAACGHDAFAGQRSEGAEQSCADRRTHHASGALAAGY